jgi:hypothetical protein
MKEGSLFCFVVMRSTHPTGMLQIMMFLVCLESSWQGGVMNHAWAFGSMKFGLAVQKFLEYWMISSLKINWNWNCSWNFWRNWNVPLVLLIFKDHDSGKFIRVKIWFWPIGRNFHWKKMAQIRQMISKKKFYRSSDFLLLVPLVSQKYIFIFIFSYFHINIWD